MSKKREYPKQEQLDDFAVWYDNLNTEKQNNLEDAVCCIDDLPEFCQEWTVREFWTAARDYLGA